MNGDTIEISTLIALAGLVLTLVALVGGVLYRLGTLASRVEQLDRRFDQQSGDMAEMREETRQEFREMREETRQEFREMREETRQELRGMREETRQELRDMREENRGNHQQLLQALAHHSHDPDTGFAIFRIPPGTEHPAG